MNRQPISFHTLFSQQQTPWSTFTVQPITKEQAAQLFQARAQQIFYEQMDRWPSAAELKRFVGYVKESGWWVGKPFPVYLLD